MSEQEAQYHMAAAKVEESVSSKLFGKPCYKINGKAFCCFFEEAMVFKLTGNDHKKAIELTKAELFDPSKKGRPMKEWVQVPFEHKKLWNKFAIAAANYVKT